MQLSARTLLLFSWIISGWQNQGEDIPPPTDNQPNTPFGPFGFRPGPWKDALDDSMEVYLKN